MNPGTRVSGVHLPDAQSVRDLASFLRRARAICDDGARLSVTPPSPRRLDVMVPVLAKAGIMDPGPEILGTRSMALDEDHEAFDDVFEHAAILDRLERGDGSSWPLPPAPLHRAWAGQKIPRDSWERSGYVLGADLIDSDEAGSLEISKALPEDPGQPLLVQARRNIWSRPSQALGGLPLGVGFALCRLGFLPPGPEARGLRVPVFVRQGYVMLSAKHGAAVIRLGNYSP